MVGVVVYIPVLVRWKGSAVGGQRVRDSGIAAGSVWAKNFNPPSIHLWELGNSSLQKNVPRRIVVYFFYFFVRSHLCKIQVILISSSRRDRLWSSYSSTIGAWSVHILPPWMKTSILNPAHKNYRILKNYTWCVHSFYSFFHQHSWCLSTQLMSIIDVIDVSTINHACF